MPCLYPNQLALDIDRDTEDQNRYLDGMVSIYISYSDSQLCPHAVCSPVSPLRCWCGWVVKGPTSICSCWVPPTGLRFHECDWPAHGECEALFHDGEVWARQPEASVWYGRGLNRGLLHPLLPLVEDKDVNQWKPRAARLSYPGVLKT